MKKILAIHTGGTISMSLDDQGSVVQNEKNPIDNNAGLGLDEIEVENDELLNLPSPQMTPATMLQVKNRIQQAIADGIDGVVVTHGTDTLEETAYFLDLTLPNTIPVVVTGAMRSSNEIGADGVFNFKSAIQVASSDAARNKGVLVVFNTGIYSARYVTKTHTTSVDTFKDPIYGTLGTVDHDQVIFAQQLIGSEYTEINHVVDGVYMVKAYAGMTGTLFAAIQAARPAGVVVEAMGAGNLPKATLPAVQKLLDAGIPVVLVSRCFSGYAQPIYAYTGGGIELQSMGLVFCEQLNGPKARIKLIVGLSCGKSGSALQEYMSNALS
ncbi:asparaginase [Fructilactobacillus carniphilus]|uniref:Asparaginase n=1 Tax=Fructilactobacillus carniphilus TaxID=2940297 RepID=A0ABY5C057_9LACO|nr:asparaginase [Fructilactobacillus carniphilus]USS90670.1 asparaginase [Fructilactobacillus carniphilus]